MFYRRYPYLKQFWVTPRMIHLFYWFTDLKAQISAYNDILILFN